MPRMEGRPTAADHNGINTLRAFIETDRMSPREIANIGVPTVQPHVQINPESWEPVGPLITDGPTPQPDGNLDPQPYTPALAGLPSAESILSRTPFDMTSKLIAQALRKGENSLTIREQGQLKHIQDIYGPMLVYVEQAVPPLFEGEEPGVVVHRASAWSFLVARAQKYNAARVQATQEAQQQVTEIQEQLRAQAAEANARMRQQQQGPRQGMPGMPPAGKSGKQRSKNKAPKSTNGFGIKSLINWAPSTYRAVRNHPRRAAAAAGVLVLGIGGIAGFKAFGGEDEPQTAFQATTSVGTVICKNTAQLTLPEDYQGNLFAAMQKASKDNNNFGNADDFSYSSKKTIPTKDRAMIVKEIGRQLNGTKKDFAPTIGNTIAIPIACLLQK